MASDREREIERLRRALDKAEHETQRWAEHAHKTGLRLAEVAAANDTLRAREERMRAAVARHLLTIVGTVATAEPPADMPRERDGTWRWGWLMAGILGYCQTELGVLHESGEDASTWREDGARMGLDWSTVALDREEASMSEIAWLREVHEAATGGRWRVKRCDVIAEDGTLVARDATTDTEPARPEDPDAIAIAHNVGAELLAVVEAAERWRKLATDDAAEWSIAWVQAVHAASDGTGTALDALRAKVRAEREGGR